MIKLKNLIKELLEGEQHHHYGHAIKQKFFSVNNAYEIPEFQNIGSWVKFKLNNSHGKIHRLPFKIIHLQKIHDGSVAYRVENQLDTFGGVAKFNEVDIISLDDAKKLWVNNIEDVMNKYIEFKDKW